MPLDPVDLVEIVNCRAPIDDNGDPEMRLATDATDCEVVVPNNERWLVHYFELTNTDSSEHTITIWTVPGRIGDHSDTSLDWQWVPGVSVPANSVEVREPPQGQVLRILYPGTRIYVKGDGDDINIIMNAWKRTSS